MASKYGYTLESLTSMTSYEMSKLNADQSRDARRVMNDALNKRYARIEKSNLQNVSGSYAQAQKVSGVGEGQTPKFRTPKNATRNENIRALANMANLATQKTGTVTGTKKYVEELTLGLVGGAEAVSGKDLKPGERKRLLAEGKELFEQRKNDPKFWQSVRGVLGASNSRSYNFDSMDIIKRVSDEMTADLDADPSSIMLHQIQAMEREEEPDLFYDDDEDEDDPFSLIHRHDEDEDEEDEDLNWYFD